MKKISGFTLLELMAVITVGGILLALAVPAMTSFVQRSKMTTHTNKLVSALQVARNEAIKQSGFACVCSTTDASAAVPICDAGDNWESGWIAFYDTTGDCTFAPAAPDLDVLLKVAENDGFEKFTVRNDNSSINDFDFVRFNSRGSPQSANGAIQQGMFTFCDERGYELDGAGDTVMRAVLLSAAGSVRTTKDATLILPANCP